MAKTYLNKQGKSRFIALHREAAKFLVWAKKNLSSIRAKHVRVTANIQTDWLRWQTIQEGELMLKKEVFTNFSSLWTTTGRSCCLPSEPSDGSILHLVPSPSGQRNRCLNMKLAKRPDVCFPTGPIIPTLLQKIKEQQAVHGIQPCCKC